ncbi:DUF1822 family protein [filamentous cyanobacterium LEGE 11480]|uniref:DUF1822 family protein n=1 Tax=Romeriopsis navalis LEGE 11480 TaxID=2777977 RepID=A0A928VNQ4_9CYAN|nr:DUF1822 family protein [Romeriopsis navalis]MBE9029860.1 DUF1822 family protein [Romeriopsis navalis LEGE 11480]
MTDFFIDTIDFSDFQAERIDAIDLSAADIAAAQQASQSAPLREQWSTYLNTLAEVGFEQWLSQRAPEMSVRKLSPSTWQVNGFRVSSVAAPEEDEVLLPQAAIDQDQAACHLYVAVGVQEEYGQAFIAGSTRYDQLKSQSLKTEDAAYRVPFNQLDSDSNQLLLTLRCADPASIPLPAAVSIAEQVAAVKTQVTETKIRVGQWLNQKLDDLSEELAGVLMPPLQPQTVGLRSTAAPTSPADMLSEVLRTVSEQGISIPENAQSAHFELPTTDPALRLYAVVGQINSAEWSLFIALGQPDGEALPANLQLSVSDGTDILVNQQVEVARSQSYLYTQLIGEMHEGFQVTVTLPNGATHTLPEFAF